MRRTITCLGVLAVAACAWCVVVADDKPATAPAPASEWLMSIPDATAAATKTSRLILADFTGSDWCGWCMKLKAEVFDTPEFKEWAGKNVVLLEVDFPRAKKQDDATKKQNKELATKLGVRGFPTIHFLKADGTSVGQMGYQEGGPKPWIEAAQKILDAAK
ncbi:MAG: thioredoxin family protein [Planctomycetota bacterium]|nr:thioredoxin family protein [Planctomycetota bacterium]